MSQKSTTFVPVKRKILISLFLFVVAVGTAATRDQLLSLVDSAYAAAMDGRIAEAISINHEGLSQTPQDSVALQCEFYSCLLYCYHRLGDYQEALHYGELCLQYDEQHGTPQDLSASLGNLAGIYSSAGKQETAEEYLRRAIGIEQQLIAEDSTHTPKSLAIRQAMLGEVLLAKSRTQSAPDRTKTLSEALQLTEDALATDRRLGRHLQEGMRLAQLGHIYEAMGESLRAEQYTSEALIIARETGNKMTEVLCLLQLHRYQEAAARAHELGFKKQEYEACDRLYQEAKSAGRNGEALRWLEQARTIYTALQNEESERQLTAAAVRYDSYRKEQLLSEQEQVMAIHRHRTRVLIIVIILILLIVVLLVATILLLRHRKQAIEQASAYREQQYRILAHDLTNPMVAQQQVLRMLYQQSASEPLRQLLSASDSQLMLLRNLSEFTRFEKGNRPIRPIRIDLHAVASDCINAIRPIAELKQVTLLDDTAHLYVEADRDSVCTVLRNLISNAIKFSPVGGTVEIGTISPNQLYVRDHGTGMAREKIAEIESASTRIESTIGTSGETGTGLGLLLCRELIRLNKGSLRIQSRVGEGTNVVCELRIEN